MRSERNKRQFCIDEKTTSNTNRFEFIRKSFRLYFYRNYNFNIYTNLPVFIIFKNIRNYIIFNKSIIVNQQRL